VEADASRFASSLDPSGIELFEQSCHSDDWGANANVAKVSTVPIMLDKPFCGLDDIERAADIPNVGFCKLKLKRFGSHDALKQALERVRELGMEPVLGMVFQASCNAGWKAASLATSFAMPANSTDS
jgi:L-alanine-DL-glutamate epimerase-like enolase superfamily enzyme